MVHCCRSGTLGPGMMQGGMGGWFGLRVTPMNLSTDILVG